LLARDHVFALNFNKAQLKIAEALQVGQLCYIVVYRAGQEIAGRLEELNRKQV
jgi:hypothetical protein